MSPWTAARVEAHFAGWDLRPDVRDYLRFHAERYATVLRLLPETPPDDVLDVGSFLLTELLRAALPGARVHTLGESEAGWGAARAGERHAQFDLNRAQDAPLELPPHDLVVMAEVLEHLYTAPRLVLRMVAGWLRPGGTLLLQTPNAVRLGARLALLAGRHPYEPIREERRNPGHFREYTEGELRAALTAAGFEVRSVVAANHFGLTHPRRRALKRATALLPPALRDGFTVTAVRSS